MNGQQSAAYLIEREEVVKDLRRQIDSLKADLDSAWTTNRAIDRARQEEMRKRDEAQSEVARLKQVCRNIYEVWAGSEGIPKPETCAEDYLLRLVEKMRDEAKEGLR